MEKLFKKKYFFSDESSKIGTLTGTFRNEELVRWLRNIKGLMLSVYIFQVIGRTAKSLLSGLAEIQLKYIPAKLAAPI